MDPENYTACKKCKHYRFERISSATAPFDSDHRCYAPGLCTTFDPIEGKMVIKSKVAIYINRGNCKHYDEAQDDEEVCY